MIDFVGNQKIKNVVAQLQKGKKMFGTLKTVEEQSLYASFGIVDGLSDDELMDINGGALVSGTGCWVNISTGCVVNKSTSEITDGCHSGGSSSYGSSSSSS